jgi:hypothetical protein
MSMSSGFLPRCRRQIRGRCRSATATPTIYLPQRFGPCCRRGCCSRATTSTSARCAHRSRAVDGPMAVAVINIGQMEVHAIVMIPATPVMAAGAAVKWASDRIGPAAWVLLGLLVGVGIWWYLRQPPEYRERLKDPNHGALCDATRCDFTVSRCALYVSWRSLRTAPESNREFDELAHRLPERVIPRI